MTDYFNGNPVELYQRDGYVRLIDDIDINEDLCYIKIDKRDVDAIKNKDIKKLRSYSPKFIKYLFRYIIDIGYDLPFDPSEILDWLMEMGFEMCKTDLLHYHCFYGKNDLSISMNEYLIERRKIIEYLKFRDKFPESIIETNLDLEYIENALNDISVAFSPHKRIITLLNLNIGDIVKGSILAGYPNVVIDLLGIVTKFEINKSENKIFAYINFGSELEFFEIYDQWLTGPNRNFTDDETRGIIDMTNYKLITPLTKKEVNFNLNFLFMCGTHDIALRKMDKPYALKYITAIFIRMNKLNYDILPIELKELIKSEVRIWWYSNCENNKVDRWW